MHPGRDPSVPTVTRIDFCERAAFLPIVLCMQPTLCGVITELINELHLRSISAAILASLDFCGEKKWEIYQLSQLLFDTGPGNVMDRRLVWSHPPLSRCVMLMSSSF
jgi:hypothetical protein